MRIFSTVDKIGPGTGFLRTSSLAILPILIFFGCFDAVAAPADLDLSFGSAGKVVSTPDGSGQSAGTSMARQADGKIIMVGNQGNSGGLNLGFIVARYNSNGSLDTSFGTNGWSSIFFGTIADGALSVTIQSDGKIVIGGVTRVDNDNNDIAIARFNADGSIDTTFDNDGKATVSFDEFITEPVAGAMPEYLAAIRVGSDGKIVIAGSVLNNTTFNGRVILARFNADGSLDTSFGSGGRVINDLSGFGENVRDMVLLPDGKPVIVGNVTTNLGTSGIYRIFAIKLNLSGGTEWTFEQGYNATSGRWSLNAIEAIADGRFMVVGKIDNKVSAIRLTAAGTVDNTFQSSASAPAGEAYSVAVQPDGKVIAAIGPTNFGSRFSLIRFNANGSLDTGFGENGVVTTILTSGFNDISRKVLIQPDGKILVGGYSTSPARFSMVRYLGSFVPKNVPFDYDGDARADISVFRPANNRWYVFRSLTATVSETAFGLAGDVIAPADYDGDAKTDLGIFRPSTGDWWYLSTVSGGQVQTHWGSSNDVPRPSDFDGDGRTDFVVFRPSEGTWYRFGSTGQVSIVNFGLSSDKPLSGDFDGDGKSDVAIYRPSTGTWWYRSSLNGASFAGRWGVSSDVPTPADFDGDGKSDLAVYRPSEGGWYIYNSGNRTATTIAFGLAEDRTVAADYDGDGRADIGLFRPSDGFWYLLRSTAGFSAAPFGRSTDVATPAAFVP